MRSTKTTLRLTNRFGLAFLLVMALSTSAMAQGSIFGTVSNADLSVPANGEITFVGYLDDTDEEIRIESSDGAGYDAGNWFDDFQNYLTEAPGNPYDYHFYNAVNGEGFILSGDVPNNSFQQENVALALVPWPVAPSGLSGVTISGSTVLVRWTGVAGLTYHVYRRMGSSNGSFFRVDDPSGLLTNPGVAGDFFVDNTTDGLSSYSYLIVAEDPSGNLSPHSAVVTVNSAAPEAPVLVSLDPTTGTALGGTPVNVYGSGFDPAGATVLFGANPAAATVISPFHLTATTPAGAVGASVDVTVTNTASGAISNVLTGGYIYSANADPVLATIGDQTIVEGLPLNFAVTASDLDGNIPIMTSTALPGTATYIDNGDGTGNFDWATTFTDAGVYSVTFYATDAIVASSSDSEVVQITVTEAGNQTPVLAVINDTTINEAQLLALTLSATDADAEIPTLSVTDGPANSTFTDNLDGTADFSFTPDYTQAGVYDVIFKAMDAAMDVDSIIVQITVDDVNRVPVLAAVGPQVGTEEIELTFLVNAADDDGVIPLLSTSALPGTAVFTDSLNGVGLFQWTPTFTDAGVYDLTIYATDADFPADADSEVVTITINDAGNQAPVLVAIGNHSIPEGGTLGLVITASDADGTIPTLRAENLPANATFLDNADGTGAFDFVPDFVQAGLYTVTFIADDGLLSDSELVEVTVTDAGNVAPVIDSLGDFTINEGEQLIINVSATDPDGGGVFPALTLSTTLTHYNFVDNGDGTAVLTYDPDYYDSGIDTISFLAVDFGSPQQTSSMVSVVTTTDVNRPPSFAPIGPFGVAVGDSLVFTVTATDSTAAAGGDQILLSIIGLPSNAAFVDNGDGTGTFAFLPDATQDGTIQVTFLAVDQGTPQLSANLLVDITVVTENIPPILNPIGPRTVVEGAELNFTVSGSDPDGPAPALSISNGPVGAELVDNHDGTGVFTYTPDFFGSQRLESVTFKAYDGISVTKEVVLIQVYDAGNQVPIWDSVPSPSVIEGESFVQGFTARDPDHDEITLSIDESVTALPAFASFVDLGLGAGALTFEPDFTVAGTYDIYVVAADGDLADGATLSDTMVMILDVVEFGNHEPVLTAITPITMSEDDDLEITVTASDIDGDALTLTTGTLPANAAFFDNTDGTGTFTFSPDYNQAGSYEIWFYANDGTDVDSTLYAITVNDNNRAPFIEAPAYSYKLYDTDTVILTAEALDFDGTTPFLSAHLSGAEVLADNMSFVDNRDNTGTFTFIPDYTQGGSASIPNDYSVLFRATDEVYPDEWQEDAPVVFGVIDRNKPPEVIFPTGAGPYTVDEGATLSFFVQIQDDDPILASPTLTAELLPANATFTFSAGSTSGQFTFFPDFTQAGTYNVRFIGRDDRNAADTQMVQINVIEAGNQPPSFGPLVPDTMMVPTGYEYQIVVTPIDPESDSIAVEAYPMLPGATWTTSGDGSYVYAFTADTTQVGTVYEITFVVTDYPSLATDTLVTHPRVVAFLRGDMDSDNLYTVNDLAYFVEYLFRDGPSPIIQDAADTDGNGSISINDLAYLIYYMFRNGPQPMP